MWREYVRMELGFIEGLRRRWDVLGIDMLGRDVKGKEKAKEGLTVDLDGDATIAEAEAMQLDFGGGAVEADNDNDDNGIATRKAIMDGAIVKSVICSAARCECLIPLHVSLRALTY
jgi:U3 small nucleolar RNA-associated protein 6